MGTKKEKPTPPSKAAGSKPAAVVAENKEEDPLVRFNLILLDSERTRMGALQSDCKRRYGSLNHSEILRAGIGALEKLLKLSPESLQEVVDEVKRL